MSKPKPSEPREWKVYGSLAFPKGGAAYDDARESKWTHVIEKSAYDAMKKERDKWKKEAARLKRAIDDIYAAQNG